MSKVKTRKIAAKRFKITKTGKVLRRAQNARHLRLKKPKKLKRKYKKPIQVTDKQAKWIRAMIQS